MRQQQNQFNELEQSSSRKCEDLRRRLDNQVSRLKVIENNKDKLYEDDEFDIDALRALNDEIDRINGEIVSVKSNLLKLGCVETEDVQTFDDNQTILSTSSVRRKTAKELQIINAKNNVQSRNNF